MMRPISRRRFIASMAGAGALAVQGRAFAATWPSRPVTIVVPFPAGASTDVVARLLAEKLRSELGQGFVVENKIGAGGNIAATGVVRAAPDGYTLFLSTSGPLATNKLLYKSLSFDPLADFAPIALVGDVQGIVAVHPSLPVSSFAELVAYGKANPGKLTFGSPGFGLMGHVTGELIQRKAGFQMAHVPYRGSAPLSNDLLAGTVNVAIDFLPSYIPHVKSGGIRALAVTSDQRAPQLPEVPTLAEAGLPGVNATSWFALVGPKGLPDPIVARAAAIVRGYVESAEAREKLATIGVRALSGDAAAVRTAQTQEVAKWADVVRAAAISLD
ncbi:tripartite tricarboxylate transporter substrate binding protein [Bosea vestrisii]|uniref:Bug family tripartite tricarboxylate transporter substrate binding protein n=1 Tax=Bosea vestrisii TaxID=151416 RepID=UPI0024DFA2C0|nr:tripartite tricarboxylate transporter substrate binding protein [Bosea vestrisii]WID96958.1 tripartite tricarboxylate transporter substrate binding protein [Bosea vestrisii]